MAWNSSKGWRNWLAIDQDCLLCKQPSKDLLCPVCTLDIDHFSLSEYDFDLFNHVRIARELKKSNFDSLLVFAEYQWPLSWLISELKFSGKVHHSKALAELFCATQMPQKHLPQALIPIPLHLSRLVDRQYNQAVAIGKHVCKRWQLACLPDLLRRTKQTQAQTELSAQQRLDNIEDAFELKQQTHYSHVALFDDVITTGATMSAAAQCLRSIYPSMRIDAWSICITPEQRQS